MYYFTVIKMDATTTTTTIDREGQFYSFISTAICGNEHPTIIRHTVFLSFYGESSIPPPLSGLWDLP